MPVKDNPRLHILPIFAGLPDEALRFLLSHARQEEFAAGEWIIHRDERGDYLAYVAEGKVALQGPAGQVQVIDKGNAFGEAMMRYGVPSPFNARAMVPTRLWKVSRSEWLAARYLAWEQSGHAIPRGISGVPRAVLLALVCFALVALIVGPVLVGWGDAAIVRTALETQRPEMAQLYLELAVGLRPNSAALHDALGYLLYTQGQPERALPYFQRALQLDSHLASAYNNLGAALLAKSQAADAITYLKMAVDLDPGYAAALANLGGAYLAVGDHQGAMPALQQAYTIDPAQYAARARWAGLALQQGQLVEASQAWQEIAAAQPHFALARQGLGVIAVLQNRPQEALAELQAARDLEPGDAITHLYLGLALQALNRPLEAANEFILAQQFSRDIALTHLAQIYLEQTYQQMNTSGAMKEGGAAASQP
jgi:tetratricopeptide (TPR) repeat protein